MRVAKDGLLKGGFLDKSIVYLAPQLVHIELLLDIGEF
jgi:hypothetical protein